MPTFSETVYIDVDAGDFDDDDLIDELENRGYTVTKDPAADACFVDVEWHIQRGELKEALILLERQVPDLKGISGLV
jgi:hypothetical protein